MPSASAPPPWQPDQARQAHPHPEWRQHLQRRHHPQQWHVEHQQRPRAARAHADDQHHVCQLRHLAGRRHLRTDHARSPADFVRICLMSRVQPDGQRRRCWSRCVSKAVGSLILNGTNAFTGGTVINNYTLTIGSDMALGAVPNNPATNITFTGTGTLQAGVAGHHQQPHHHDDQQRDGLVRQQQSLHHQQRHHRPRGLGKAVNRGAQPLRPTPTRCQLPQECRHPQRLRPQRERHQRPRHGQPHLLQWRRPPVHWRDTSGRTITNLAGGATFDVNNTNSNNSYQPVRNILLDITFYIRNGIGTKRSFTNICSQNKINSFWNHIWTGAFAGWVFLTTGS